MPRSVSSLYGSSPCPPATTRRRLCSSYVRPNHNSRDRQLPSRDSFPPRGVGRFKKRKSPTRALRNFWRLQFVVLLSVPAILVSGLNLRQSNSASVATWLYKRYVISSPFSSFVVGPQTTIPYSYRTATMRSTRAS